MLISFLPTVLVLAHHSELANHCLTWTRAEEGHQRGHTVEILEQRRSHFFELGVYLVERLATTLISCGQVEKLGEVLHSP